MPNADPGIEDPSASLIFLPSADRRSLHSDPVVGKFLRYELEKAGWSVSEKFSYQQNFPP
jgi:hypothetical protein